MLFVCHFMSFDSAYVIHATRTLSDISQLTTNYILASRNVYCAVFIHGLSLVFYGTKERNREKKKNVVFRLYRTFKYYRNNYLYIDNEEWN